VQQDKIEPTCESYKIIVKYIKDPLLCVKLSFFKSLTSDVEPFLREFQLDTPLVPFLHSALSLMLENVLLERFMEPEVIKSISSVSLKDVRTEANLSVKNIILDFDTINAIRKVDIKTDMLSTGLQEVSPKVCFRINNTITVNVFSDKSCYLFSLMSKPHSFKIRLSQEMFT